jgi:protein-ribulosamine 3-kinase
MPVLPDLTEIMAKALNLRVNSISLEPLHGGSINQGFKARVNQKILLFCKLNRLALYPDLFNTEATSLGILKKIGILRVPEVLSCAILEDWQVLVLEWIEPGRPQERFWRIFGEQLAGLHRVSHDRFGLDQNNYMGAIPQDNTFAPDWNTFFIQRRIGPLVSRSLSRSLLETRQAARFENLYRSLPSLFPPTPPSLLHGDLWSGNFLCDKEGKPVLIDPAVYYGHRGMDLGMSRLFGGFDEAFYETYQHFYPLKPHHRRQEEICNLYPLLIHLLLFGKSYLPAILDTISGY